MDQAVADAVVDRADEHCESCGWPGSLLALHHRKPKRMGGRQDYELDTVENLIAVHPMCHITIHQNRDGLSYELGHLVHEWDDPAEIPVTVRLRKQV